MAKEAVLVASATAVSVTPLPLVDKLASYLTLSEAEIEFLD